MSLENQVKQTFGPEIAGTSRGCLKGLRRMLVFNFWPVIALGGCALVRTQFDSVCEFTDTIPSGGALQLLQRPYLGLRELIVSPEKSRKERA